MTEFRGVDPTQVNPVTLEVSGSFTGLPGNEPTVHRPQDSSVPDSRSRSPTAYPTVEGYEILEVLGRGGMGVVYKARQIGLKRIVALKMILAGGHAGESHLARFRAEAESAARLQHPNIVQVYEVGESGGFPFFSQEFVEGGTLSQRLNGVPQPARPAAELMVLLAEAIDYAHQKGVVHRDLKPSNILLGTGGLSPREETSEAGRSHSTAPRSASSGSNVLSAAQAYRFGIPKVADFGLAKQLDDQSGRTESGSILGTPSYMAPEQAGGRTQEIGPAADTYALGAMLYELLTGRPPFRGESSLETLEQVRTQEPVAPRQLQPKVPPDLETICLKCLRKERTHRYATSGDLAADLRAFLDGRPIAARPAGLVERGWRWCRRKPWTAAFAAASLIVVLALFVGAWYRQQFLQSQQLAKASEEVAQTQRYYSLVNSARELAATAPLGWTWRANEDIENAAKAPGNLVDLPELRSLAADCWTRFDLKAPCSIAEGTAPSALAFSPDGKKLAIAEKKNSLLLSVFVYNVETRERVAHLSFSTVGGSLERLIQGTGSFQEGINALAFSPDGRWIVVGTRFGKLCRWDLTEADPQASIWQAHGAKEHVNSLTFTPDGDTLVSGSDGKGIKLWQISLDWKESSVLPDLEAITEVKYARQGVLAVATQNRLRLYLTPAMQPLHSQREEVAARHFAVSPGGRLIAMKGSSEIHLVATDGRAEDRILALPDEDALVRGVSSEFLSFSPDGSLLASPWADRRIRIWNVASGRVVATVPIPGDENPIPVFSPEGRFLAVSGDKQTLVYELRTSDLSATLAKQPSTVQAIDFVRSGQMLVTTADRGFPDEVADSTLCWWDASSGKLLQESRVEGFRGMSPVRFAPLPNSLAVHPQGTLVAVNSALVGTRLVSFSEPTQRGRIAALPDLLPVVDLTESEFETSEDSQDIEVRSDPRAVDGKAIRLAAGGGRREVFVAVPNSCRKIADERAGWGVYAAIRVESKGEAGRAFELTAISAKGRDVHPVDLTQFPEGDYHWQLIDVMAGKGLDREPNLRFSVGVPENPADLQAVWVDRMMFVPFNVHSWPGDLRVFPQGPLAFSKSGHRLWGVLDAGQVVSWRVPELTVAERWNIASASQVLGRLSIRPLSAGDKWVVAGSNLGDTFVLAAATGKLENTWRDKGRSIRSLVLGPNEDVVAIGTENGGVQIAKLPSGETVETLAGHTEAVESLVFSSDGKLLATGSHDRTVRLWQKGETGFEHLLTLPASGRVRSVRLTPDGKKLAVLAESERAVRVWHLDRLNERLKSIDLGW